MGFGRVYSFLRKIGFNHTPAQKFHEGRYRSLPLDHVERLCLRLHCTPNDLLEWSPGDLRVDGDHPLYGLVKKSELDLLSEIRDLPLERLNELKQKLGEWKGEGS